jgi:hypothetical protein
MKAIRKELEERLSSKVQFKKAKLSKKEFSDIKENIISYLETNSIYASEVTRSTKKQKVIVKAIISNEQIKNLQDKFGSENLDIIKIEQKNDGILAYTRDFPFLNIGGGQMIIADDDGTGNSTNYSDDKYPKCTSGYIAYKNNQAFMVTAGHCIPKPNATGTTYEVAEGNSKDGYKVLGYQHWSGFDNTEKYDLGLIRLTNTTMAVTSRFYTNNNGGAIDGQLKPQLSIGSSGIYQGLAINKSGNKTGITGLIVSEADTTYNSPGVDNIKVVKATLRSGYGKLIDGFYNAASGQGDSGATVYSASGYSLIGVLSGIDSVNAYKASDNLYYGDTVYISPAYHAKTLHGSTFYQYNFNYDTPVSQMQGQ